MLFSKKAENNNTSIKPILSDRTKKELSYAIRISIGHRSIEQFGRIMKMIDPKPIVSLIKMNYNELPDRQLLRKIANASEGRITHTHLYNLVGYSEFDSEEDRSWATWSPERGSVYLVDFGFHEDSIQGSVRPALVMQNDKGNLHSSTTVVIPISSRCKQFSSKIHILLEKELGFKQNSFAFVEQIKCVSLRRFFYNSVPYKITTLPEHKLLEIKNALEFELGFEPLYFDEEKIFKLISHIRSLENNVKIKKSHNLIALLNEKMSELINYCKKHKRDYKYVLNEYDRINNYGYNAVSI